MHKYIFKAIGLGLLLLAASCNDAATDAPSADAGAATSVAAAPAGDSHAGHDHAPGEGHGAAEIAPPPTEVTLADGTVVPVIAVAALNTNPKDYAGTFAIDGTVGEVFADKGRFMLKDNGVACGDASCSGCAADQQLPVSFDLASLEGAVPAQASRVLVVADVKPSDAGGFTLAVREVREGSGEKAVCSCCPSGKDGGKAHDHAGHGHDDHDHEGHDHAEHDDHKAGDDSATT